MNSGRMLIDSADSLGDEDENGDIPYQEHDMSWEDAVVSEEDDECEENEDGVLILPSHEASEAEEEQVSSSSFSIPESVPSDVRSVQISTEPRLPVQQVTVTLFRNTQSRGGDDSDDEPDLLSDSASRGVNVHATVLIRGETRVKSSPPRIYIWVQVTAVIALLFLMASMAYLVNDRHQLQARVKLEAELHQEQIRRLREDHEAQLAAALEEERLAYQQKSSTTPPKTREKDPKTPLRDHGWAQEQLRQCSRNAATHVKKHVSSLAQSAFETTKGLYTQVKNDMPYIEEWWNDVVDTTKDQYTQVKKNVPHFEEWWSDAVDSTKGFFTHVKNDVSYIEEWWYESSGKIKEKAREQQQSRYGESSSSSPPSKTKSTDNHQKREPRADQNKESSSSNQNEESSSSAPKENEKSKMGNFKAVGKAVLTTVAVGALATVLSAGLEAFYSDINGDNAAGEYTRSMPDL